MPFIGQAVTNQSAYYSSTLTRGPTRTYEWLENRKYLNLLFIHPEYFTNGHVADTNERASSKFKLYVFNWQLVCGRPFFHLVKVILSYLIVLPNSLFISYSLFGWGFCGDLIWQNLPNQSTVRSVQTQLSVVSIKRTVAIYVVAMLGKFCFEDHGLHCFIVSPLQKLLCEFVSLGKGVLAKWFICRSLISSKIFVANRTE